MILFSFLMGIVIKKRLDFNFLVAFATIYRIAKLKVLVGFNCI